MLLTRSSTATSPSDSWFHARPPHALCALWSSLVMLFACLGVSAAARAQGAPPLEQPNDLLTPLAEGGASTLIPPLPEGFTRVRVGDVEWCFHPSIATLADELQHVLPRKLLTVANELGVAVPGPLEIRVARSPEEMRRLAPSVAPPPSYAVGVAYPALGLIVVSTVAPESWMPPDMGQVLTHELSHVLLHRAVHGHAVPLWFTEGLAVSQAGEHRLKRVQALWEAAIVDDILPIADLSRSFPSGAAQANLAYAQSADLVQHLMRDERGKERLRELVRVIGEGATFEEALLRAYHIDSFTLEREFRRALSERFRVLPMLLTGTVLWGGIAVLALLAFVRRRRAQRAQLAQWEVEEAAAEAPRPRIQIVAHAVSPQPEQAQQPPWFAQAIEPGVPTIEHEGERHTLH